MYESRNPLRHPVLVLAFAGWNDAGAAATTAIRYLTEQLVAAKFASIDPEDFYDFSVQRPVVRLVQGTDRQIQWPSYDVYQGAGIGTDRDFLLGLGAEPNMRWRGFCDSILRIARDCGVEMIVSLGAYLDEVLYTRPVPLTGTSTEEKLITELDLIPSRYQGPTGIVGIIGEACRREGIPHASLWPPSPIIFPRLPTPEEHWRWSCA